MDGNSHWVGHGDVLPSYYVAAVDASFKAFLGASEDLIRNIHGVAPVAELDGDEIGYLVAKVAEIKRQRQRSRVMWIFTKHGFYSAVCARQGDGKRNQPVDPDRIMVRARMQTHLEALKKRFSDLLEDCEIQESAGTDYAFRLFVSKTDWVQVLAGLAEETDYDNFKSEVANHQGVAGAAYEHSLHDVWSVMHNLQKGTNCHGTISQPPPLPSPANCHR